jgi:O-antigen/teichoic acid export membrane protein
MTGSDQEYKTAKVAVPLSYVRQFITGASGEAFSQLVTIVTQLAMVPVLLLLWGQEQLGLWLMLSAVPTYLTLGDLGLTSIFGTEITARRMAGDTHGEEVAIHSSWYTTRVITMCAVLFSFAFALAAPGFVPLIDGTTQTDIQLTMLLLCISVSISLAQGTVGAGMRVIGLAGVMSGVNAMARLAESVALLVVAATSSNLPLAALAMLLARAFVLLTARAVFLHRNLQFRPATRLASRQLIWRLMPASAGYFSFTFGNAALIQLPAIVIGNLLSPSAVVVFSAARTLSRMGRMLVSIVNHAIDPIFTQLAGAKATNLQQTARLHRRGIFCFSALYLVLATVLGPTVLAWWTHGATRGYDAVYFVLLAAVMLEICWFTLQVPYISINQHHVFGWVYLVLASLAALALFVVMPSYGLLGAALSILACHVVFTVYTLVMVRTRPIRLEPTKI